MPFVKLPSKKKSQHVVEQILESIRMGEYGVGDKLPAEYEIAQMTGVSRPAVREALGALRLLGIIDSKAGSGTFVKSIVDRPDVVSLIGTCGNPFEALEARAYLEPAAASLAMKVQDEERMEAVGQEIRKMRAANSHGDIEAVYRSDRNFHGAIGDASENSFVRDFIHTLLVTCLDSEFGTKLRRAYLVEHRYRSAILRIHEAIYEAMKRSDLMGMQSAFAEHFRRVEDQLLSSSSHGSKRSPVAIELGKGTIPKAPREYPQSAGAAHQLETTERNP